MISTQIIIEISITFECTFFANTLSTIEFNDYIAAYPRAGSLPYAIYLGVLFHIPTPRKNFKNLQGRGAFLEGKPVNLSLGMPTTSVDYSVTLTASASVT